MPAYSGLVSCELCEAGCEVVEAPIFDDLLVHAIERGCIVERDLETLGICLGDEPLNQKIIHSLCSAHGRYLSLASL